jgi:hypothetical protein
MDGPDYLAVSGMARLHRMVLVLQGLSWIVPRPWIKGSAPPAKRMSCVSLLKTAGMKGLSNPETKG